MYETIKMTSPGENFYAGEFPTARGIFNVKEGETIKKETIVTTDEEGNAQAATSATMAEMVGIANSDGEKSVSVDFTGEILLSAVILPEGVTTAEAVKTARKRCIFLK